MIDRLSARIRLVLQAGHPIRLLVAYVLRKTTLSRLFYIYRDHYRMRFFPSALLMHYWADRSAREEEPLFLGRLVKIGSNVVDVGANVGTLSLPLSRYVGSEGRVFSIEANPTIYDYLLGNIEVNGFKNIKAFRCALGERTGRVAFSDISSDDMNRVLEASEDSQLTVPLTTLDRLLEPERLSHVRLLKIDVEGYELFVLRGGQRLLEITDIVYFESWEHHFQAYGYSTADLLRFLRERGFYTFRIENDRLLEVEPTYRSRQCENLIAFRNLRDLECIYEES